MLIFFYALIVIVSLISWIELNNIFKKIKLKKSLKNINVFLSFIYLSFFTFIVCYSYHEKISLIFILLVCIFSDIGGYIIGKTIGGKKLTKISPKKTLSGVLGSFTLSLLSLFLLEIILTYFFSDEIQSKTITFLEPQFFFLAIILSLTAQVGDLTISYFKRLEKIKDVGKILPGHGGIFDRIDSLMYVIILGLLLYNFKIIP